MALCLRRGPPIIRCLKFQVARYQTNFEPTLPSGIPPPLRGIKVLDLTRVLAGPTATMVCQLYRKLNTFRNIYRILVASG
jgi:hypothetical protein